jgi:hypothetical protein
VGARFSALVQIGPRAHLASCTVGTGSLPGVKRPGRGVNHPPPSSAEVKKRVELYPYSPSGPSWPLLGRTLPFFTFTIHLHPIPLECVLFCGANVAYSVYRLLPRAGRSGVRIPIRAEIFLFSTRSELAIRLTQPLTERVPCFLSWGIKLATHLHVVPRLRMSGYIPLLLLFDLIAWTGTALNFKFSVLFLPSRLRRYFPDGWPSVMGV